MATLSAQKHTTVDVPLWHERPPGHDIASNFYTTPYGGPSHAGQVSDVAGWCQSFAADAEAEPAPALPGRGAVVDAVGGARGRQGIWRARCVR
jgi:hypothetical protein